jgi:hypothetical protein
MHWILHGSIAPAVADALVRHKQKTHKLVEAGLPSDATAPELLRGAQEKQWEIVTNDPNVATEPFVGGERFNRTVVYLQLSGGEVEQDDAIDRLFTRYKRLVPGRMYTVTESRVKIRQLPREPRGTSMAESESAI